MFIPGRIEVLGKHTDYCGGRSIVCAIDRGFHADIELRNDSVVEIENLDLAETGSFDLADPPQKAGHWIDYAVTVGKRLTANFTERLLKGCTIRFRSDLPKAAGLSSSSALMIMVFAALDKANDLRSTDAYRENIHSDLDLAEYLGCIENGQSFHGFAGSEGVGTFGGSQDHAAILLGKNGVLSKFAFCPLRHEADFPFPADLTFVVASSGVVAEKTGAALERYNRVSRMVSEITTVLGGGPLAEIINERGFEAVRLKMRSRKFSFSASELIDRVEQFHIESGDIISNASEAIETGDYAALGGWIDFSQTNAEQFLQNQIEETSSLQRLARNLGALAASAFGAGFGGSVYAIVRSAAASEFTEQWRTHYSYRFPQHAGRCEFFTTRPSQIILA